MHEVQVRGRAEPRGRAGCAAEDLTREQLQGPQGGGHDLNVSAATCHANDTSSSPWWGQVLDQGQGWVVM